MGHKRLGMEMFTFDHKEEMEIQLAYKIANELRAAITQKGRASILVSGGSTPVGLFHLLSCQHLEWDKVKIGLVDERFVAPDDEQSNEKLVRGHLLQQQAAEASFAGMVRDLSDYENNLRLVNVSYAGFRNEIPDVVILGMGDDGHTASLFPGDKVSEQDLLHSTVPEIINTNAPKEPKKRITCNVKLLQQSNLLVLMICGQKKMEVLNKASNLKLPISYFLENEKLITFYSN